MIVWGGISDSDQAGFMYPATVLADLGGLRCDQLGTAYLGSDVGSRP